MIRKTAFIMLLGWLVLIAINGIAGDHGPLMKNDLQKGQFATIMDANVLLLQKNIAYSGDNPVYVGYAAPGTADSATGWLIIKIAYSGSNPTSTRFADNDVTFSKEWDERASYSY